MAETLKKPPLCKFHLSKSGCRAGTQCRFLHISEFVPAALRSLPVVNDKPASSSSQGKKPQKPQSAAALKVADVTALGASTFEKSSATPARRLASNPSGKRPAERKPIARPQMTQIASAPLALSAQLEAFKRRYPNAQISLSKITPDAQTVTCQIVPTDPDFPFQLENNKLSLEMDVPESYPATPITSVRIANLEVPIDLRKNLAAELERWSAERHALNLVALLNLLDRRLEDVLSGRPIVSSVKFGATLRAAVTPSPATIETTEEKVEESQTESETFEPTSQVPSTSTNEIQRGIQIRVMEHLLLHIALLEPITMQFQVECKRCKLNVVVSNIIPNRDRALECAKCHNVMKLRYRPSSLHEGSNSFGFLDLDECLIADLLPSVYKPTCSECFIDESSGVAVEQQLFKRLQIGSPQTQTCCNCHVKLTARLGHVRFVPIGQLDILKQEGTSNEAKPRRRKKDQKEPGLVVGEPLPKNGTCKHYSKSFRWMRFPCCGRLFPCDKCHIENSDANHEILLANRMVCGFCSKEQPFGDKGCSGCGSDLTKSKSAGGFWEGGQGTRDPVRMSKNDPKKYSGLQKTTSMKSHRVGKKAG